MVVPYANRAAVASLPSLALASKPATVKEVIEDFATQVPHERAFECIQLIKGRTIRVVFPSAHMMEEMVHTGLTFRAHPIEFKVPSVFHWVTLLDLPYGIPEVEIRTVLSRFGQIAHVNSESYMGLYTGTRLIKIELKHAIPSHIIVAGHVCTTFYKGQVRSCFRCGLTGHEAKKCPGRQQTPPSGNAPGNEETVSPTEPSAQSEPSPGQGARMATTPPKSPRTFAEVVASPPRNDGPVHVSPVVNIDSGSQSDGSGEVLPPKAAATVQPPPVQRVPLRVERDRSPLNKPRCDSSSLSDSSGEVSPPNTDATNHPPRPQDNQGVERDRSPIRPRHPRGPLDRRPVSIRTKELHEEAHRLSEDDVSFEVEQIERIERQLKAKRKSRRDDAALHLQYRHLILDNAFAARAFKAKLDNNEDTEEVSDFVLSAKEALAEFEVDHPDLSGSSS